jgi:hypothetical protein
MLGLGLKPTWNQIWGLLVQFLYRRASLPSLTLESMSYAAITSFLIKSHFILLLPFFIIKSTCNFAFLLLILASRSRIIFTHTGELEDIYFELLELVRMLKEHTLFMSLSLFKCMHPKG